MSAGWRDWQCVAYVMVAATATVLTACREAPKPERHDVPVSYAYREAGSALSPTNWTSVSLISADGPLRHDKFRKLISDADKECSFVTSAVLKGALEGTDEWHVTCDDSGIWSVWFRERKRTEIISCSSAGPYRGRGASDDGLDAICK